MNKNIIFRYIGYAFFRFDFHVVLSRCNIFSRNNCDNPVFYFHQRPKKYKTLGILQIEESSNKKQTQRGVKVK